MAASGWLGEEPSFLGRVLTMAWFGWRRTLSSKMKMHSSSGCHIGLQCEVILGVLNTCWSLRKLCVVYLYMAIYHFTTLYILFFLFLFLVSESEAAWCFSYYMVPRSIFELFVTFFFFFLLCILYLGSYTCHLRLLAIVCCEHFISFVACIWINWCIFRSFESM